MSAAAASNSIAKSRSPTASSELPAMPSKPELGRHARAVDRVRRAGERGGAQRQHVDPFAAVGQTRRVACQHRVVRHQVVAERDRLRDLQVREARHDRVGVRFGEVEQRPPQRRERRRDLVDGAAQPQAHVGGDLVVARAAGVQSLAGIADQRRQALLDVEVDILEVARPDEHAARDLVADLRHAALDVGQVLRAEDAAGGQHARMGERSGDVGFGQALVEVDRRGEALDAFRHRFRKTAGPAAGGTAGRTRGGGGGCLGVGHRGFLGKRG